VFGGEPAELLHGSLLFNLVSFLQATLSFFLAEKNSPSAIMAEGLRVANFLRTYGQPQHAFLMGLFSLLDALIDCPLEELLTAVCLAPPLWRRS